MGQFSVEKLALLGSALSGNQQGMASCLVLPILVHAFFERESSEDSSRCELGWIDHMSFNKFVAEIHFLYVQLK
jgi:hypothetical protein